MSHPTNERLSRTFYLSVAWMALTGLIAGCGESHSSSDAEPQKTARTDSQETESKTKPQNSAESKTSSPDGQSQRSNSATSNASDEAPSSTAVSTPSGGSKPAASSEPQVDESDQFEFVAPDLSAQQLDQGWISLFDGRTLFGWKANSAAAWRVVEGAIECSGDTPGLLLTDFEFDDFELQCEFWLEPGGNSGVFLRTVANPQAVDRDCYELNICDSHESFPTASLVGRHLCQPVPKVEGRWAQFHVTFRHRQVQVQVDGQTVVDFTDETDGFRNTGRIGLQMNQGRIRFRNLYLRPINTSALFDGSDLENWQVVPGSEAKFEVVDGRIDVQGGPGFLETVGTYADFILQFEARTNAVGVNSGVFFRAEPGTEEAPSNGYELQLCNLFADGDRTKPNDYGTGFGTGAIFRFAKARWVVPNDNQWFHVTLAAQGSRMQSWIDGYPVARFDDQRPPNPNPRRGQRLAAGHFSLQGHDAGTQISFRNIRIQDLAASQ